MDKQKMNKWLIVLAILWIVWFGYSAFASWQYEQVIGSYMENAYDMNTPSRMLEQLYNAKNGMVNEGLTPDTYGAIIFKKPDNKMDFQYSHIDSIIERVTAVEEWRATVYETGKSTATENLGDVYEAKMTNLRNFIMEGVRSDWIARNAWFIQNHPLIYIGRFGNMEKSKTQIPQSTILVLSAILLSIFILWYNPKHKKPEYKSVSEKINE